ncbi:MAG TPA: flagellar hook-length control protein FliK, partial [Pseudomonadales bacterium]|nr:flagellar hook-length control protein FliK [Pseudomonadales bacterium]
RASHRKDEKKKQVSIWNVTLAFDLDFIGPMQIQLRINDKLASATIWAEREQTLRTTRNAVDDLKASLTNIGLSVASIECKPGLPSYKGSPLEHRLVDVKT